MFPRRRKPPRPVTPALLEKAALAYLERFASSAATLRRVLLRRVERSARLHGTDRAEGTRQIDDLVERYRTAGLLDDKRYAEAAAETLRRRGASARAIRAKLAAKGVDAEAAGAALAKAGAGEEAELAAALAFARRRRLGPFRPQAERAAKRARDLAALARAGFGYDVARKAVDTRET